MSEDNSVNRRRLLRRAGTVAAGLGAAGVASAVAASPANAAAGDPAVLGANDAGANTTSITSSNSTTTLSLTNTGGGAPLVLNPGTSWPTGPALGAIGVDDGDFLAYGVGASDYYASVYDDLWANMTFPLPAPERVLDTRNAAGRSTVLNPTALQSNGMVKANTTIHVMLFPTIGTNAGWVISAGAAALHGNLTITEPTSFGYATIYPYGKDKPSTSNVNYAGGQIVPNAVFTGLGYSAVEDLDVVSIYCVAATHVILDVSGIVGNWYNVASRYQPAPAVKAGFSASAPTRTRRAKLNRKFG